jgi:predicted ATPase
MTESLGLVEKTRERCREAELHRLKGEPPLKRGQEADAEECFRHAFRTARGQAAMAWELRAAMSLGRLCCAQGTPSGTLHARELLGAIYSSFTEGNDTPDTRDARGLLKALN